MSIFLDWKTPLYLARKPGSAILSIETIGRCASIERLKTLISPMDDRVQSWQDVENTQQAAHACAVDEVAEFCVTNEHDLKKHGLEIVREL